MIPIETQIWIIKYEDGTVNQIEVEECGGIYKCDGWVIEADSIWDALEEYKLEEKHIISITVYQKIATATYKEAQE